MAQIKRVVIDPGHGGIDPKTGEYQTAGKQYHFVGPDGAVTLSLYEGERQRLLAKYLASALLWAGFEAWDSLTGREIVQPSQWVPDHRDVPLSERVANANKIARDCGPTGETLLISLHSNAISSGSTGPGAAASGICVYTSRGQTASDAVADAIHAALAPLDSDPDAPHRRSNGREDGDPDYEAGFYILRRTVCPAVLVELGFHDNLHDARWLLRDKTLEKVAQLYAAGIVAAAGGAP